MTATGADSALGRIAALLTTSTGLTPLQRRLVGFGRVLAAVTVVLCAVVLAAGLVRGQPFELMAVTAISLAVAAVPESLPAVVTLALALGARRMAEPERDRAQAACGRDPRLGDGDRQRQDRDPDRRQDDRRAPVDALR